MKKVSLPENTVIIYGLALADAFTIAYGLVVLDTFSADPFARAFIILRGLVVGAVGGLALAITANRLPRARAKSEKAAGWAAFGVILTSVTAIISPVTYSTLNPAIVAAVAPWVRVVISLAAGLLVPALTAAVAFTSGRLDAETQSKAQVSETSDAASEKPANGKRTKSLTCNWCGADKKQDGQPFANSQQVSAHKRTCAKRPGNDE